MNVPSPRSGDQTTPDCAITVAPSTRKIRVERMLRIGHTTLAVLALLAAARFARGAADGSIRQEPPRIRIVLVGDSTVTDRTGLGATDSGCSSATTSSA